MHRVTEVEPLAGYRLRLRFDDGVGGVVDVSALAGHGVFAEWTDPKFFERVTVDDRSGTVVWPNGADLAPDSLYARIRRALDSSARTSTDGALDIPPHRTLP